MKVNQATPTAPKETLLYPNISTQLKSLTLGIQKKNHSEIGGKATISFIIKLQIT